MEKICPKCQNGDIVELRGYFITDTAFNIPNGPQSTKFVCSKCGYVIEEKIDPKQIKSYQR
jgi:transcription initiation factor TFIIIB Brf1 subunit/transcription initiation factor TFIIB